MLNLTIYHCFFCRMDFGLSTVIQPCCPCCRNEDDVLLIAESKTLYLKEEMV